KGGFVVGSDMLYYLDVGLRQVGDPFITFRYTHVFALRLASVLMGSTLGGVRLFSGAVGGLTVLLTYFSARFLTKEAKLPNGLIAIFLIMSVPLVVTLVLGPSVDTTLMVIVLAFVALYIVYRHDAKSGRWLLGILGVLFIMAIRTKEVGWALVVIIPGFGFSTDEKFRWQLLGANLRFFFLGTVIGVSIMVIANAIFLGTPLFGLRPADLASYYATWSDLVRSKPTPAATLADLVIGDNPIVFVLFAAAGLWFGKSLSKATRVLWLFPLVLLGLLLIGTTRTAWSIVPRGFLSGIVVMGLLASRVFAVHLPMHRRSIQLSLVAVLTAVGVALFGFVTKNDLAYGVYYEQALVPALLGLILMLMIFYQNREYSGWAVFLLLFAITANTARLNVSSVARQLESSGWRTRFNLPLAIGASIDLTRPFDAYFSWGSLEGLVGVANRDELAGLINSALDGQTVRSDYQIGTVDEPMIRSMESAEHKYVVVTASEWDWLRTAPQDRPEWRDRYEAFAEPGGRYVLLTLIED
ncbi:MAG: hypothetical protein J4N74_05670, partial [Chloroflexi bacterium]|nr:hypothetical protein [Chloroflexota bacterium]